MSVADGAVVCCRACGYDLAGLDADATCPECAAPVAVSMRGDRLAECEPRWVAGLSRGAWLLLIGFVVGTVAAIAGSTGLSVVAQLNVPISPLVVTVVCVLATVCALVYIAGVWLLTTPDPGRADREPTLSLRRLARYGVMADVVTTPATTYLTPGAAGGSGSTLMLSGSLQAVVEWVTLVAFVVSLVGWLAMLLHIRGLARRVPAPRVARHALIVTFGYGIAMAIGFVANCIYFSQGSAVMSGQTTLGAVFIAGGCVSFAGIMFFSLWMFFVLFGLNRVLRRTAAAARTGWSAIAPEAGR